MSSAHKRRSQPANGRNLADKASNASPSKPNMTTGSPIFSPTTKHKVLPKDYLLSKDQSVEGATIEAAIELLSSSVIPASAGFLYEFLMTYRSFVSPSQLMVLLRQRLTPPNAAGSDLALIRLRVVNILKNWINHCHRDWEGSFQLPEMFASLVETAQEDAVLLKHLEPLRQLLAKLRENKEPSSSAHIIPKSSIPLYRIQTQLKVLKETPADVLAEQFTIIDQELYEAIAPWDMITWSRNTESDREMACPNLYRLVDRYYEVASFVATTVVSEPDLDSRVDLIKKFLDIARAAHELGNYNLFMAAYSGLTHPILKRLVMTWDKVPADYLKLINSFIKYCDPEDNFDAMRAYTEVTSSVRPCIPFLGGYLAEMSQIHSMNSDYLTTISSKGEKLINYGKQRKLYTIISAIKRCNPKLNVTRKESILNMFKRLHTLASDGLKIKVNDLQEASMVDPIESEDSPTQSGFDAVATPRYPVSVLSTLNDTPNLHHPDDQEYDEGFVPMIHSSSASSIGPAEANPTSSTQNTLTRDLADASTQTTFLATSPRTSLPESITKSKSANAVSGRVLRDETGGTASSSGDSGKIMKRGTSVNTAKGILGQERQKTNSDPSLDKKYIIRTTSPVQLGYATDGISNQQGSSAPSIGLESDKKSKKAATKRPTSGKKDGLNSPSNSPASTLTHKSIAPQLHAFDDDESAKPHHFLASPGTSPQYTVNPMVTQRSGQSSPAKLKQLAALNDFSRFPNSTNYSTIADSTDDSSRATPQISAAKNYSPPLTFRSGQSLDSARSNPDLQMEKKRYDIAIEMLETEEMFVYYLKMLVEDGVSPLRAKIPKKSSRSQFEVAASTSPSNATPANVPTDFLPENDIKTIFSNVEALYSFHSLFLEDLHNAVRNWKFGGLGVLFSQYHHGFESYIEYTNARHAGDLLLQQILNGKLEEAEGTTPSLKAKRRILQRQQEVILSKTGTANLLALLNMPVHRLPRILLQLRDYQASTPESHPEYVVISDAIAKLESIARKLPMTKEDAEQAIHALQVLGKIVGWKAKNKIRPGRRFEGEFEAKIFNLTTNSFHKFTVLIWSDILMFCKQKTSSKAASKRKWIVVGRLKLTHIYFETLTSKQAKQKVREVTKEFKKNTGADQGSSEVDVRKGRIYYHQQSGSAGSDQGQASVNWAKYPYLLEMTYLGLDWILSFPSEEIGEQFIKIAQTQKQRIVALHASYPLLNTPSNNSGPFACESAALATVGSEVYLFGGSFREQWRNDIYSWNVTERVWKKLAVKGDAPLARTEHAMCSLGTNIFVFGGQRFGSYIDDMYSFDTLTNTWSKIDLKSDPSSHPPSPRSGHSMNAIGGKLYVFGGQWFETLHHTHLFNDIYEFDPTTSIWTKLKPKIKQNSPNDTPISSPTSSRTPTPRQQHVSVVIDNTLVIFGGSGASSELNDVCIYSPQTNTWEICSDVYGYIPSERASAAATVFGKKLVVFGGCASSSNPSKGSSNLETFNDIFVFDIEDRKWSHCWVPVELEPRRAHNIVSAPDNTLAIFCGHAVHQNQDSESTSDLILLHGLSTIVNNSEERAGKLEKLRARVEKLANLAIHHQALLTVIGSHYVTPVSSEGVKWDPLATKSTFTIIENLGDGLLTDKHAGQMGDNSLGQVYKAIHEPSGTLVAIKVISHHHCSLEQLDILADEMQILSRCRHPVLVHYHGFAPVSSELWIVSELSSGCSLDQLMKITGVALSEKQVSALLVAVLEALSYLHGQNVFHKGLKASNVLINADGRVKLTGWGLSDNWRPTSTFEGFAGSTYSSNSDIYDLGLMITGLLENTAPSRQLRTRHKFSCEALDFVALCTASLAHRRPSAIKLLSHPFILPQLQNAQRDDVLRSLFSEAATKWPGLSGTGKRASVSLSADAIGSNRKSLSTIGPLGSSNNSLTAYSPLQSREQRRKSTSLNPSEELLRLKTVIEDLRDEHNLERAIWNQKIEFLQSQNSELSSRLQALENLILQGNFQK